jgi:hypothetical protein
MWPSLPAPIPLWQLWSINLDLPRSRLVLITGSLPERQPPNTKPGLLDDHHGSSFKSWSGLRQRSFEPRNDPRRSVASKPDDADPGAAAAECSNVAEVEIRRKDDPAASCRVLQNFAVARCREAELERMHGVVSIAAQPFRDKGG